MTDSITLAYTAGIIDGEGSIILNRHNGRRNYRVPKIHVAMTAEPVISFLHQTFGGWMALRPRRTLDMFEWRMSGQSALDLMADLRPYLREPRKVARVNFLLSPSFRLEQADRTPSTDMKRARRERIYDQFHAL